jgi:triacylglycerol esterase/lipase EstA (alpha/beta hydrolase family)
MRRKPLLTTLVLALAAVLAAPATAAIAGTAPSSGINNWSCQPSAQHPEPVVLMHGLGANATDNFATLAPTIADQGYCVFDQTYGTGVLGPEVGGLAPMEDSAAQLSTFVNQVLAATGAAQVDIVGHSEGTTVTAYYLKFLGGAAKVKHFVGFGANYMGTTLDGLATLAKLLNLGSLLSGVGCPACTEYLPGSTFLQTLDSGGVAVPGPTYTNIVSRYDEVVTPYTSGIIPGANVTNIVIQDQCTLDFTGHLGQAIDPNVAAYVLDALDPATATPVNCVPFYDFGA